MLHKIKRKLKKLSSLINYNLNQASYPIIHLHILYGKCHEETKKIKKNLTPRVFFPHCFPYHI